MSTIKSSITQLIFGIALVVTITALCLLYGGHSAGDDTYIYMRYVGNALAGHGFTFNPGEASFGVTSPLWTFVMVPAARLFGNSVWTWKVTSAVLLGAAGACLFGMLARFKIGTRTAVLLSLMAMAEPHTFRWASSGMENSLAVLLLVLTASLMHAASEQVKDGPSIALGVVLGLLPFARPELIVVTLILGAYLLITYNPPALAALWITGLGMAIATLSAFGGLLPQTAAAKAIFLHQTNRFYGIEQGLVITVTGCLGCLILLALPFATFSEMQLFTSAAVATVLVSLDYLAVRNQLVSTRYATCLSFPIVLAAVIKAAEMIGAGKRKVILALALQAAMSIGVLWYVFPATRTDEGAQIKVVADALKGSGKRVALTEVGAFAFYSDCYVVDLVGLTDKRTLAWGKQHGKPQNTTDLESLLIARNADAYISVVGETYGSGLDFLPLGSYPVRRANYSRSAVVPEVWRVYALRRRTR